MTTGAAFPAISIREAYARLTGPGAPFEIESREIAGIPLRVWKNAPPTLREAFAAGRAHGDKTFLVHGEDRVSFEAFARAALAVAAILHDLGVHKGDRVAIVMRNLPEWPVAFFGAILIGAIATPLNAWGTGPELEYGLTDSGAKVAFVDRERLVRLFSHLHACPALQRVFVCGEGEEVAHPLVRKLEDLIGQPNDWARLPDQALPSADLRPEDDATLFYTSGTTGKPKGALGTHRNSCTTILARPFAAAFAQLRRGEAPPAPSPNAAQKATLLAVPYFHTTGCQAVLIPSFVAGTKIVTMRKWDPELALRLIERERINSAGGVPTIAWQLIEHPRLANYDLSSLDGFTYGGAPAPGELVRRIKAKFPKAAPGTAWGMTETSATFTHHTTEDYELRPDSCGLPLPVCDMKIVGEDGRERRVGETGELQVRGPSVVKGYWGRPEETRQTFVDGWLHTGDIGKLDEEGFLTLVDRAKDMLIRGGENIYCIEVENALYEHPAVVDAAVVGIAHRMLGEEPGAIVTLKPGAHADEAELRAFVAERLAAFKVPVKIIFRHEILPRNPNGKILKSELRPLFAASVADA
jgi:long-chain acyl-CoA synthetase